MKIKKNQKKLSLKKVTIENLDDKSLKKVVAGMPPATKRSRCVDFC